MTAARVGRLLVAAVAVIASGVYAYTFLFSQFQYYDDEGDLMLSVKGFLDGRPLYEEGLPQYGPFYYLLAKVFFTALQAPVSHDLTRLATIALWLTTAALAAAVVYRLTASSGWSLAAGLQTVLHCRAVANEPGHPQAILIALTMAAPLVAAVVTPAPRASIVLGAIVACMTLTKVNVGVYSAGALLLAFLALTRRRPAITTALIVASVAASGAPFVLMRDADWAQNYAWISAVSIAACCVTLWRIDGVDHLQTKVLGWFIAAGVMATVLILTIAGLVGTSSLGAIVETSVVLPARFPALASVPWRLPSSAVVWGEVSLALAVAVAFLGPVHKAWLGIVLKVAFGVTIAVAMSKSRDVMLSVAPWLWVVLLPAPGTTSTLEGRFSRVVICLLAACHLLIGYPVAGSQESWATLLLIPAAAVGLADASSVLTWRLTLPLRRIAEPVMLALVIWFYYTRLPTMESLYRYQALTPLSLPGSARVRLRPDDVHIYRDITASLSRDCDTFISMPGLNSFYFWTGQDPPAGFDSSSWMIFYDEERQQRIVAQLTTHKSPCVLYNALINDERSGGRDIERGPLVRYIRSSFSTARKIGDFELMKPSARAPG